MTSTAAEYGKMNPRIPLTPLHTTMPALAGWEEEEDAPFPADLNSTQFMPSHLPFFYSKSSFPVIMGDVAETEETLEYINSPEK